MRKKLGILCLILFVSFETNDAYFGRSPFLPPYIQINSRKRTSLKICEVYCLDGKKLRGATLNKDSAHYVYPPLIYHIQVEKNWASLVDMIEFETGLPKSYTMELVKFGAVYLSAEGEVKRDLSRQKKSNEGGGAPLNLKTKRITDATIRVPIGTYCRVHANPRRYPAAYTLVDWQHIIRFQSEDSNLVFVDKIAGLPVAATVDNLIENLQYQLTSHLFGPDSTKQLYLSSRLDACTSGIMPFSKDAETSARLNKVVSGRDIGKIYKVLCRKPVPLGVLRHCFRRKSKRHDNAKPTLLREYDDRLVSSTSAAVVSDDEGIVASAGTKGSTSISSSKNSLELVQPQSGTAAGKSSRSGSAAKTGRVWQLAELEVLSCRKLDAHELCDALLKGEEHQGEDQQLTSVPTSTTFSPTPKSNTLGSLRKEKTRSLRSRLIQRRSSRWMESTSASDVEHNQQRDKDDVVTAAAANKQQQQEEEEGQEYYECEVELVTGRTHQIRLQFAAIGSPILGDSRYEPAAGMLDDTGDVDEFLVDVFAKERPFSDSSNRSTSSSIGDGSHLFGPEPKRYVVMYMLRYRHSA
jgi:23S rRNA-/tRNA-specific pseudouridylate synthase